MARWMVVRACCLLVVAAPALAARPVDRGEELARYLGAVQGMYQNLDYEHALEHIRHAREFSRGSADDVVLSLWEGLLLRELNRREESEDAFRAGLLLDPTADLPVRVAPKVREEFERIREALPRTPRPPPLPRVEPPLVNQPGPIAPMPKPASSRAWIPALGGGLALGASAFFLIQSASWYAQLNGTGGQPLDDATARSYRDQGKLFEVVGWSALGIGCAAELFAWWRWKRVDVAAPGQPSLSFGPNGLSVGWAARWP